MSNSITAKRDRATRRAHRVRTRVQGTTQRPRLSVFRSLKHISAQLIDDATGTTIVSAHDSEVKAKDKTAKAAEVGTLIAKKAKEKNITAVVFDRGSYRYHGRVKALADAAREGGLEF